MNINTRGKGCSAYWYFLSTVKEGPSSKWVESPEFKAFPLFCCWNFISTFNVYLRWRGGHRQNALRVIPFPASRTLDMNVHYHLTLGIVAPWFPPSIIVFLEAPLRWSTVQVTQLRQGWDQLIKTLRNAPALPSSENALGAFTSIFLVPQSPSGARDLGRPNPVDACSIWSSRIWYQSTSLSWWVTRMVSDLWPFA